MLELRGIGKYFPSNGVTALKNADFTLRPGEIHSLLGENGTGKSTLMHILSGYLVPSAGNILLDGKKRHFSAPADALGFGIGMVRQHPGFVRGFRVWEDCILGAEKEKTRTPAKGIAALGQEWRSLFPDPGLWRKRVQQTAADWGFDLPTDKRTELLTVSQRQKAAVLALLLRDVTWFIFDEPTAVLAPGEAEALFLIFRRLRESGRGVVFITHKLDEALAISDRITVMRHGETGNPLNAKDLSAAALKKIIFGAEETAAGRDPQVSDRTSVSNEGEAPAETLRPSIPARRQVLVIKDLTLEVPGLPHIRNVNLELAPGLIFGIAGVRDSGLETLELAIAGLLNNSDAGGFKGVITLNGHDITGKGVRAFRNAGGAYLGKDRLGGNLAPALPLRESLIIHAYRRARISPKMPLKLPFPLKPAGFLDMAYLDSHCRKIMERAGIARSASGRADSFSGGMIQRILLAREFAEDASLLVLAEAGSGLDQIHRAALDKELKELARNGKTILLFSASAEEIIGVADEIALLRNGTIAERFKAAQGMNHGE